MNPSLNFSDLGLSAELLETIAKKGFTTPSEIQAKAIPLILQGQHDVVGIAQTGTGKTGAFGLPLVDRISGQGKIKALILTPTRELALQVSTALNSFSGKKRLRIFSIYGGQSISLQMRELRRGMDIVVGTPGRMLDLIERKAIDLSGVEFFILDEADEMLNMGFIDDVETILKQTAVKKRVFLFSATMPLRIQTLSKKYMHDQVVVEVKKQEVQKHHIEQIYYRVPHGYKLAAITNTIALEENFYGIIFCQTKAAVDQLTQLLKAAGLRVDCIHGDIKQNQRERILQKFRDKEVTILVATDVAARGIDVQNLTHVVNYSLPIESEVYVHRIGRTGRAGKTGIAISFVDPREEYKIQKIARETKNTIVPREIPNSGTLHKKQQQKTLHALKEILENKDTSAYSKISSALVEKFGGEKIAAALLYFIHGEPQGTSSPSTKEPEDRPKQAGRKFSPRPQGRSGFSKPKSGRFQRNWKRR